MFFLNFVFISQIPLFPFSFIGIPKHGVFPCFSHELWTTSNLCTHPYISIWQHVDRICKTANHLTHKNRSETAQLCRLDFASISGCCFDMLALFGRGAGVFVKWVRHTGGPTHPPQCSPQINVSLSPKNRVSVRLQSILRYYVSQ